MSVAVTTTMIESPRVGDFDYCTATESEAKCLSPHRVPGRLGLVYLCTRRRRHVGDHAFGHDGFIVAAWPKGTR